MTALPSGTVTFLFTDVEGSTRLLAELGAERYAEVLAEHRRVLREAFAAHGGVEVGTEGDSFFVAFGRAGDALAAASKARETLAGAVLVRMGIHTGEPLLTDEGYVGMDVHRAARIAAVGHGGQILVSQATRELAGGDGLRDLGEHRLKDLTKAERLWQLGEDEFPPLRSLHRTRLPVAAAPLVGRGPELARIRDDLKSGARLLTVTGAGGSGKTRLALQAAAELSEEFTGGAYFVALAPLSDAGAIQAAVARALELQPDDDVLERLRLSHTLLVLDNAEHLPAVEHEVAKLRVGNTALLVTSRRPLHLSGERELPLDPLPDEDAVELFIARAVERGHVIPADDTARAICRRLDNLPLAIELAASRLSVLSPAALLERLDRALPLLTDGARDADERQRTLRATIDWSFRLLSEGAQRALRRLAIFRGGFSLEAAEAVAGADLEVVSELVDHSLVKRVVGDRYFMLETIREFGLEEQADDLALAHADYYAARIRATEPDLRGPRMAEHLGWYRDESENIWAALDALADGGREDDAFGLVVLLWLYWVTVGEFRRPARWLEHRLRESSSSAPAATRARIKLAELLMALGAIDDARRTLSVAETHAVAAGDSRTLVELYRTVFGLELMTRDLDAAIGHARAAADHARSLDERTRLLTDSDVALALVEAGRLDEAEPIIEGLPDAFAALGDVFNEANSLHFLAVVAFERRRHSEAAASLDRAIERLRPTGAQVPLAAAITGRGFVAMAAGHRAEARRAFGEALEVVIETGSDAIAVELLDHIAVFGAAYDRVAAGRLYATVTARRDALGLPRIPRDLPVYERVLAGTELSGDTMPWDEAVTVAQSLVSRNLD